MQIGSGQAAPLGGPRLDSGLVSNAVSAYVAAPAQPRMRELLAGAAPVTAEEQLWVGQVVQAVEGYLTIMRTLVAEGTRQAALGRDLYGRARGGEDHEREQRVLDLVNVERSRYGLGQLGYNQQLDAAAESHNWVQATRQAMAHEGIGDGDPGSRIRATGFAGSWGENVATGQLSPEQVVAEWMASPGHRRNILDPNFRQLGVSVNTAADGRTYWTQEFGA